MVWSKGLLHDERVFEILFQDSRSKEVIDAPTNVPAAGIREVAPPAVFSCLIGIEESERIDESCVQEFLETHPLFICESCISSVRLRVCQVDFFVCDIQISTYEDRLYGLKPSHVIQKQWIP